MKLKDLKTGFLVETREGEFYRVIRDYPCKLNEDGSYDYEDIFLDGPHYDYFNNYNDDLTNCESEELDIVTVCYQKLGDSDYTVIWEREDFNGYSKTLELLYNMGYRYITVEQGTLYTYKEATNVNMPIASTRESIQLFARFFTTLGPDFYYQISQYDDKEGETYYILLPTKKVAMV